MSREARKRDLLEAAARVLHERGVHGTTVREVAAEAGVGLATVYHYVGGKGDLVYQVEARILQAAVASAQAALVGRGARERLRALLTDHVGRVLARPVEAAVLAGRLRPPGGEGARRLEALRQRYLAVVQAASESTLRLPASRAREAPWRTSLLLGMVDRVALDALGERPVPPPGRLAARAMAVFLEGARRGR